MKRLPYSLIVLAGVMAFAIGASGAFFSDTETSTANTFTAGDLDLKVDNTSYYNGVLNTETTWAPADLNDGQGPGPDNSYRFLNFLDIKPSDWGEDTISLHVETNDAWACYNVTLTSNDDNTCNEPENIDDPTCNAVPDDTLDGELGEEVQFALWADDGDNVLETGEKIIQQGTLSSVIPNLNGALADSAGGILGLEGDPMVGEQSYYLGKYWCFGTLGLNRVPAGQGVNPTVATGFTCDGSGLDNATQTDILTADVSFSAVQARNNLDFLCDPPEVTPSVTPSPTPPQLACISGFATKAQSASQGLRKDGSAVLVGRSNPLYALVPQTTGSAFDPAPADNTFFSLGFKNNGVGDGGNVVVGFSQPFYDGPGDDIRVYEVTGGPPYPDEKVKVEVSSNPGGPWTLITASLTKDGTVDLNGIVASAQYVRLTDVSNIALFEVTADAYDVDGVEALCLNENELSLIDQ